MTLELIKQHLNLDNNLDDNLLTSYATSAEHAISSYTHTDYDATNPSHEQAKLLIIGSWYETRENEIIGDSIKEMPLSVKFLLDMQMEVVI